MTVTAVGQDEHSNIGTVVMSTAVGTGVGYAMKYLWPVNKQELNIKNEHERNISPRRFVNLGYKVANENKVEELLRLSERTPAQDCFIKMAKSKDKSTFSRGNIAKEIKNLGDESGKELEVIINNVDKSARRIYKYLLASNNFMLRRIRPVVPFLVAGAGAGFLTGFMRNVLRTDA